MNRNIDISDCYNGDKKCPYLKEHWIKTHEEGTDFWMYDHSYCALNECMFADFEKPYDFDRFK